VVTNLIAEALQGADDAICGYAARQFHTASTGINLSFT
jgi:hypothetical protein